MAAALVSIDLIDSEAKQRPRALDRNGLQPLAVLDDTNKANPLSLPIGSAHTNQVRFYFCAPWSAKIVRGRASVPAVLAISSAPRRLIKTSVSSY